MKASATSIPAVASSDKSWFAVFSDLIKARLTFLVLLTTLVGFYVGTTGPFDLSLMIGTLIGTAMLACGAAALNQLCEKDYDAKIPRTETRPLPAGKLQPDTVLIFGAACSIAGLI